MATFLVGEDFDMRLVGYLADDSERKQGINLPPTTARPAAA